MSLPASTLDRLTIIYRKWIEERLRSGKEHNKWMEEAKNLFAVASDENIQLARIFSLGAINAAIWERQNWIRHYARSNDTSPAGELAFDLLKLNDWRAGLMGEEKF